jgi:1,4-dihydroxy-2-naphthoyl-CoA hydrolase
MMDMLKILTDNVLPFAKHIGVEFVSASKDRVVGRMIVKPELCTRPDILHGGAVMAFADTLGAAGTVLNLAEGAWTTTIESKTNFIAPAAVNSTVTGETTPVHRGRRTMIWQTKVTTADGRLVALVMQTQLVFDKPSPTSR